MSIFQGMNIQRAKYVKALMEENHSYRSIHKKYQLRYIKRSDWWVNENRPNHKLPHGNYIIGLQICSIADKIINKTKNE